ncbi:hypothetical protein RND81_01G024800 [Saponaria officinalis]|uniref:Uncharacterized protein n=1 Tax=Saponaria officinalis TaxID=3572 RepID=A0AAW1NFM0_SAPOF
MLKFGRKFNIIESLSHQQFSSTSISQKHPINLPNYLVESLGFSTQQSLSTSAKLSNFWRIQGPRKVSDFNFVFKANSIIDFFKLHGFNDSHIRKIVSFDPRILTVKIDKTLKPKFKILHELGFSGSDLVQVISSNPGFIHRHLDPAVCALKVVLGTNENVIRVLKQSSRFQLSWASKYLISNVTLLENEYCIHRDVIHRHILRNPRVFVVKTDIFQDILIRVEKTLDLPRDIPSFLHGVELLFSLNDDKVESRCRVFKSFGWSDFDVRTMVRQMPNCLGLTEAMITKKLDFFMNVLGYKSGFLAARARLLSYSLEKRLFPRHRVLTVLLETGLVDEIFYSAFRITDALFLQKFVLPFKDVKPDLLALYSDTKACPADVSSKSV